MIWCENKSRWCSAYVCTRDECEYEYKSKDEIINELREELSQSKEEAKQWELDAKRYCAELGEIKIAEEQGLLVKLPKETDSGHVSYIYQGSVYVVRIENIGHVISKRKVTTFYGNYEAAKKALKSGVSE
jgi:hypothetical protein